MKKLLALTALLVFSTYVYSTPVSDNGKLKVTGNQMVNECGNAVQLKGISSMGLQWYGIGQCLSTADMDYMVNTIGIDVFRAAMYVNENGYLTDKTKYANMVNTIVDWCEARGIYVLIDWHILTPGDPNASINDAKTFWADMSNRHKGKKHVLYEICNEPNGVSWSTVKTYADQIIPIIRANDPDTIIIVGTPNWSQLGNDVVNNKLNYTNIMYAFHFYAATHSTALLTPFTNQLPIFCTEWGLSEASGTGTLDQNNANAFMSIFDGNNTGGQKISWCGWSWCDKNETSAYLQSGSCGSNPPRFTTAGNYAITKIQTNPNNWTACSATTPTFTRTITPGGPTFTHTATATPFAGIRVNCGGPVYTNAEGTWLADKAYAAGSWGYVGGTVADRGNIAVGNTTDDVLYQTERYADPVEYRFDIPNGNYTVTLKMCESYWGNTTGGTGSRIFDINLEGTTVVNNLDIYAVAGYNNAYDVTVNVTVNDGQLNISMPADNDNGLVHAIKIVTAVSATSTPTRTNTFTFTRTFTHTSTRTNTPVPPTNTYTFTHTRTNTPIPPTNTYTHTNTRTFTPIPPTFTFTHTNTRTNTPVPPTGTYTGTNTQTYTPIPPTNTFTHTNTGTGTPIPPTATFTNTLTSTQIIPTNTFTVQPTGTFTRTYTSTTTATVVPPTSTFTNYATNTHTVTVTHTATNAATAAATFTGTNTIQQSTATHTATATASHTPVLTNTYTQSATSTVYIPSHTHTFTSTVAQNTNTPTFTVTRTATQMFTASHTYTQTAAIFTPTETNTAAGTATPTLTEMPSEKEKFEAAVTLIYPSPFSPGADKAFYAMLTSSRQILKLKYRVYSSSYRLIRKGETEPDYTAGSPRAIIEAKNFMYLANGNYYICFEAIDPKGEKKTLSAKVLTIIK